MKAIGWFLAITALLCGEIVAVNHLHRGDGALQPPNPSSSVHEMVEAELHSAEAGESVTAGPPFPPTSMERFDFTGKLDGQYDPFSQVRHLVDGVFHEHEKRVKEGAELPASSFLEVKSYIRGTSSSASSSSSSSSSPSDKPTEQQGSHRIPAVVRASLSSSPPRSSLPIKVNSPTVMSHALGVHQLKEGYAFAHLAEEGDETTAVLLETRATVVQSFCEICILVMQMKERGEPHLCAGLNSRHWITCTEVLESILRADKALVYWLKEGCMHLDPQGPEIVRPCPAINVCSWIPNLFTPPPTIVRDEVESLCPKDLRFLPTIPQEYQALLGTT